MGDRSNIFIQHDKHDAGVFGVGIYSHWDGVGLHKAAIDALNTAEARSRIGDPSYLSRIVIHKVLERLASANDPNGFGIWVSSPPDNDGHPILVIDALTGDHWLANIEDFRLPRSLAEL